MNELNTNLLKRIAILQYLSTLSVEKILQHVTQRSIIVRGKTLQIEVCFCV